MVAFLKIQLQMGNTNAVKIKNAVVKKWITADEYLQITGVVYTA